MATIRDRPLLTESYENIKQFVPSEGSIYIQGKSVEERSIHSKEWENNTNNINFLNIEVQEPNSFTATFNSKMYEVQLRSSKQINELVSHFQNKEVYIDITGLSHHIWAPLIKGSLFNRIAIKAVYVEPKEYSFSKTITEGEIFDLSEKITGIKAIPGFASLTEINDENVCFIPLIGFEGIRLSHILEEVQPPVDKIIPIIGLPGFKVQYPFYTYHGNQSALTSTKSWKDVRFAIANCPFSLFYTLEDIAKEYPQDLLKISPIGTKPHALGAILYYLMRSRNVEIIYDHPIRKATRTQGTSKLFVYNICKLPLFSST